MYDAFADRAIAAQIFDLIDQSHLSLGRKFGATGEAEDGRLNEADCRGSARMMGLDEDGFWRLLRPTPPTDGRVTFDEWVAALEKIFVLNKIKREGEPTDINGTLQYALADMQRDNWRGRCTIRFRGGTAGRHYQIWKPIIEGWDCFDEGKSSVNLVYRGVVGEIQVEGLNEHCPANPRSSLFGTWPELKRGLMHDLVHDVYIEDCSY